MKIQKSTIVRTVMLLMVVINFFLEKLGLDLIKTDESAVLLYVETLLEIAVIAVSFWYNNSFSENALKAQAFLQSLREEEYHNG